MKTFLKLVLFLLLLTNFVTAQTDRYCILSYNDFGPQVIASEIIGFQWWQWNSNGDCNPDSIPNIKVVVYKDIDIAEVKDIFKIDQSQLQDYRYVEYSDAISYLDTKIKESRDLDSTTFSDLIVQLDMSKKRISYQLHKP